MNSLAQAMTNLPGHTVHIRANGSGELLSPAELIVQSWPAGNGLGQAIIACTRQQELIGSRDAQIARRQVWEEIAQLIAIDDESRRGRLKSELKARLRALCISVG